MVLIYNRDKSIEYQTPVTPELLAMFGDDYKIFCHAWITNKCLHIGKRVRDREW